MDSPISLELVYIKTLTDFLLELVFFRLGPGVPAHKFFCIGFCLAVCVCRSRFRGLPQDMAVPSRCLRRDFPKKVKSIFSYGIARPLENKLRMNFDA